MNTDNLIKLISITDEEHPIGELRCEPLGSLLSISRDDTIIFNAIPNRGRAEISAKVILMWSEKVKRWLAITYGKTTPAFDGGAHIIDNFREGYYVPNDSACRKILEAYKIPEGEVSLLDVRCMNPSQLKNYMKRKC